MYTEADFFDLGATQPVPAASLHEASQSTSRNLQAPPRLVPLTARPAAPDPQTTIADLRFPAELVHERAAEFTAQARQHGERHSMQLWRDACRESLVALAHAATHMPKQAKCEALFWQLEGDEYHVSATFSLPLPSFLH